MKCVFSPINLPFKKPVCSFEIMSLSTNLNLFAIDPEAILYTVSKSVKGRQFFKNCFGLLTFGIHVGFGLLKGFPFYNRNLRISEQNVLTASKILWKCLQRIHWVLGFYHFSFLTKYLIFPHNLKNPSNFPDSISESWNSVAINVVFYLYVIRVILCSGI